MNATQTLAHYARKLRYRDIPGEVIERAKACILDTLAVSLYGSTKPWSKTVSEFVRSARSRKATPPYSAVSKRPRRSAPPSPMAPWRMPLSSTTCVNPALAFIQAPRHSCQPSRWRKK